MHPENRAYEMLLCSHLAGFVERLRELKPEEWDYTPNVAAATPRTLAVHAWQWLVCDRQHIHEPDASQHPRIPEPPDDTQALCDVLAEETETWRTMLRELTQEQLDAPRLQFNLPENKLTVRGFVCHMIQNVIYKHGQFSTLYFALGHDGTGPYTAPFPNPIYEELFGPPPAE